MNKIYICSFYNYNDASQGFFTYVVEYNRTISQFSDIDNVANILREQLSKERSWDINKLSITILNWRRMETPE